MIWACHSSFPWPRTLKGLAPIPWQELLGNEAVLTAPPADLAEQQAQFRRKLKQVGIIQKCFQGPCQDKDAQEAVSTLGKKDRREARAAKKLEPKKRPGRPLRRRFRRLVQMRRMSRTVGRERLFGDLRRSRALRR